MTQEQLGELCRHTVEIWRACIGKGEEGANNSGSFLTQDLGGKVGYEWCALFVGYGFRIAYHEMGLDPPRWLYRSALRPEPGAKRLWEGIAAAGRAFGANATADLAPGDVVLWRQKTAGHHHIAGVIDVDTDGIIETIEGNVGRFPAKVKILHHDVFREPNFVGFASLRKARP